MNCRQWLPLCAVLVSALANAQSSVTMYGIMDAGVTYVSNQGGKQNWLMDTGMMSPNLFGVRGAESLGGGTKAVFTIEGQYALDNGASIGGLFGRQSFVGLSSSWGTLTLGKHYDFSFDVLAPQRYGSSFKYVSLHNLRQGPFGGLGIPTMPGGALDFDRVGGAERIANSIKFTSTNYGGLSFGGLYGFGEAAGQASRNRAYSAGVSYGSGPFGFGAAITEVRYAGINDGKDGIRTWGLGGRYAVGDANFNALYTNTRNTFTGGGVQVFQAGVTKVVLPNTTVLLDYQYQRGNAVLEKNYAHQFGVTLDYEFSTRTDTYIGAVYQSVGGGASAQAWIPGLPGAADGQRQVLVRAGLRHLF
ncbi:porin [Cupriavidus basilensis]|uniref:porin n=1 Tax=Cupriavidus basilensis TaxID=68895 RepID=UPI0023E7BB09|nr:porin [Cupriavidus basilensis]MDF3889108.1 porin [Cupriavidus basilensis]